MLRIGTIKNFKKIDTAFKFCYNTPMNYKTYAKALFESFLEKDESNFNIFFEKFIKDLNNKKRTSLLPKILKEVRKYIELAQKKDVTEIVLKNKNDFSKFEEKIKEVSNNFNLEDIKIVENKNIVGGFILRNSKYVYDKSYKQGLLKMYQKITK